MISSITEGQSSSHEPVALAEGGNISLFFKDQTHWFDLWSRLASPEI